MAGLERLGKYEVSEVLGKGAMGVVYKGFDPVIERHVALKTVRKELIDEDSAGEVLRRFRKEAQAAGRLSHPGIVSVYEFGEDEHTAFIAMEFVQGRSLRDRLARRERFSLEHVMGIMAQLLEALEFAHEHGVVHRDIKPANLMITADGRLKIADFGIAHIERSSLTIVGSVMGTPSYMSPEQFAGLPVDRRTDVYSAGVVLFELLTGSKPFEGSTDTLARDISRMPHRNPSELSPGAVPPVFDAVVARALAKEAADRYQSARDFEDALRIAHEGQSVVPDDATELNTRLDESPSSGEASGPPAGWAPEMLQALERALLSAVGPIARVLVRNAAQTTADSQVLVSLLAETISGEREKREFLAEAASSLQRGSRTAEVTPSAAEIPQPARPGKPIEAHEIQTAADRLAKYLGPIAKVVAKRAAAQVQDLRSLYLRCAENIDNEADRDRFLKDAGYG